MRHKLAEVERQFQLSVPFQSKKKKEGERDGYTNLSFQRRKRNREKIRQTRTASNHVVLPTAEISVNSPTGSLWPLSFSSPKPLLEIPRELGICSLFLSFYPWKAAMTFLQLSRRVLFLLFHLFFKPDRQQEHVV